MSDPPAAAFSSGAPPRPGLRVLLVHPGFPDTFWSFKHALKFIRKRASMPPLGLLTVAALLPERWEKRLVDENVRPLSEKDLAWAEVVMVGGMIAQRESARAILARCRAAGKTIVAGGPLFTAEHGSFPEVDHFVLNEAELTLPEFLADFEAGRARRIYAAAGFADVARSPAPRWDLVDLRWYASASVQFSRGCPFDCEFCNVTAMLGHRPRTKEPAQVVAELDDLWRRGWRGSIFFVDDNFIGNRRLLREGLLPALTEWRRGKEGIVFYTEASINLADDGDLTRRMVEAGFDSVFVGIETPEEAGLAECDKRQNRNRDLAADVRRLQNAGLQVQGGFIVGFDSDTPSVFERQVEFIQGSGIVTAMVGILSALPGTRLHRRLRDEGRLLGETSGNNGDGTTNFATRMDPRALRDGFRRILRQIYEPGPYYRRVRTFLREYRPPPAGFSVRVRDAWTLFYASLRLGVVGRERFHYWGLLAWTLFRRPWLLRMAVTLAVYGHHFRRITEGLSAGMQA
jgi:radical SAM superfamily enzyme YgiQ (UPF0313 family)